MDNTIGKCANCGAVIDFGSASCKNCGNPVASQTPQNKESAAQNLNSDPSARSAVPAPPADYAAEQLLAFASGLPAWSIEPPPVVVRRKSRI
jgi:predicted amidophosphoribosyltransferase